MRYEIIPSESFIKLYENIGYYGIGNIEIVIELEENLDIEIKEADINYWEYEDGVLLVETL